MPAPVHKKYEVSKYRRTEGPTFELWDETFHCVPEGPGGLMSTLVAGVDYDAQGNEIYRATNVNRFMEMILLEEREVAQTEQPIDDNGDPGGNRDPIEVMVVEPCDDLQRWRLLMQDKNRPVPLALLVEIVMDLSKYYTERPTEPSRP